MSYSWPEFTFPPINLWNVPAQPYASWALNPKMPAPRPRDPEIAAQRANAIKTLRDLSSPR